MTCDDPTLDALLPPEDASSYLDERWNLKRGTRALNVYRRVGGGPKFYRIGNDVRYTKRLLDEWVRAV
jgi:hypothetical protein